MHALAIAGSGEAIDADTGSQSNKRDPEEIASGEPAHMSLPRTFLPGKCDAIPDESQTPLAATSTNELTPTPMPT